MKRIKSFLCTGILLFFLNVQAQVGINTTTPDSSAMLDIFSNSQGLLIPRVMLTGINDITTITLKTNESKPTTGLLLYNMANAGVGRNSVSPGFYYFNGISWTRLHNEGYNLQFEQTAELQASSNINTYLVLPGLETSNIKLPYAGVYKITGTGYYSAGAQTGTGDGVGIASLALEMTVNGSSSIVKERFVSAVSLDLGTNTDFDSIGQQVSYTFSFEANTTDEYQFAVLGREWNAVNTSEDGFFGKDTENLTRSNGQNDAYRGSLIVSLIEQY